jgi:FkbM family methyltransferase
MTDHSQYGEQLAVFDALGGEEEVRANPDKIMEIGAWNAKTFSNSRALIECGWKAVMVEPSPGPMQGLLDEYGDNPSITLVQGAIGFDDHFIRMHITDDAVSTSDEKCFEQWKNATKFRGSMHVAVITLEKLIKQFGSGKVWSIDAEGVSVDLFTRLMALKIFPKVLVVEHDNRLPELLQVATEAGYLCSFANATNAVVVQK